MIALPVWARACSAPWFSPVRVGPMLAALLLWGSVLAGEPPEGQPLFQQGCLMCHGRVGMGTGLLARRMKPELAELEKREDLSAAFVIAAARGGIGNMPMITRGEVSDAQLTSIARYLSRGRP